MKPNIRPREAARKWKLAQIIPEQIQIPEGGKQRIVVTDDLHMVITGQTQEDFASLLEELTLRDAIWKSMYLTSES